MATIRVTITHEIDLNVLLEQFKKSWKIPFDGSKKTCCMLFEDLVFGRHMNPSTAQQIVESVRHYIIEKNWSGIKSQTVLRINPRLEG